MGEDAKKTPSKAKVHAKSTRQEILDAYTELISTVEGQPSPSSTPQRSLAQDTIRTLTDVKLALSSQLDKLVEQLLKKLSDLQDLMKELETERTRLLDEHRDTKQRLEMARTEAKRQFETEQEKLTQVALDAAEQSDLIRTREEEAYTYQLGLKRRADEDSYRVERAKIEAGLTEREAVLKSREAEIKVMERDLAAVDGRIQDAVALSTDSLRAELERTHQQTVKELQTAHTHSEELTKLKVSTLESTIATQRSEIDQLKRQLESATKQLKEVAVSVIEGRAPQTVPEAHKESVR